MPFCCWQWRASHARCALSTLQRPPLCDAGIVADTCFRLGGQVPKGHSGTDKFALGALTVEALTEQLAVDRASVLAFLTAIGASNLEERVARDSLAFLVSCSELCQKAVAKIPAHHRPPSSDVACYLEDGSGRPTCDIDVSEEAFTGVFFDQNNGTDGFEEHLRQERAQYRRKSAKRRSISSHIRGQRISPAIRDQMDPARSMFFLLIAVANLFRIYPLTQIDVNVDMSAPAVAKMGGGAAPMHQWKQKVRKVNVKAQAYVALALRNMGKGAVPHVMKQWFGDNEKETRAEVRRVLNSISDVLSNVDYQYPGRDCEGDDYAYVYPEMVIGDLYAKTISTDLKLDKTDSRLPGTRTTSGSLSTTSVNCTWMCHSRNRLKR